MLLDYLGRLRDGWDTVLVKNDEPGTITTLSRVTATGQSVIDISKTGLRGLGIVVVNTAGEYHTTADTYVVTIEAADEEDFDGGAGTVDTVATFPSFPETGSTKAVAANIMVRRIHTQKKYLRSVLTASNASDMTTGMTIGIFIADMISEED